MGIPVRNSNEKYTYADYLSLPVDEQYELIKEMKCCHKFLIFISIDNSHKYLIFFYKGVLFFVR